MQLESFQSVRPRNAHRDFVPPGKLRLHRSVRLLATLLTVNLTACRFGRFDGDSVLPGDYGPTQSGSAGNYTNAGAGTQAAQAGNTVTSAIQAMGGSPAVAAAGVGSAGVSGASGSASTSNAAGASAAGSSGAMAPKAGTGATLPVGPCDLSGRWLSTVHTVTDALGQQQIAHSYVYYEITQKGDAFSVSKGMDCGDDAVGSGSFAATVDFHAAWAAVASKAGYSGRTGTSSMASGGCQIEFAKWYTVRGATVPYYTDPSRPMPTVDNKATGTQPGWEDWDADGNPGVTGLVSGVVTGKIFTAPRVWTQVSGSTSNIAATFKLTVQWDQEANVMSYDGSPLLLSDAARAADATVHFAEFARLGADQAVGDDNAICKSVVTLASTLTPIAAGM